MNIFQAIGFAFRYGGMVLRYAPIVIKAVRTVEKLMSDAPGEQKRKAAVDAILYAVAQFGFDLSQKVRDAIGKAVDLVVSVLNLRGEFSRSDPGEEKEEVSEKALSTAAKAAAKEAGARQKRMDELEALLTRE